MPVLRRKEVRVRPAKKGDVERLIAIHTAAFPDERSPERRRRNFELNAYGPFANLRVLEHERALVGHAFSFAFEAFFGGKRVRTAGIASVGIAPEVRGRGLAAHLLAALEAEAHARGDAIALLYPFRQAFYRRHGYAPVTPFVRIEVSPRAIPDVWVAAARKAKLRAMTARDTASVQAIFLEHAKRSTGVVVRPNLLWERKFLSDRRHAVVLEGRDGRVRGCVAFFHEQREAHADIELVVDDLFAADDEARCTLFGALGTQRDQVRTLAWMATLDDPFVLALEDANRDRGGTEAIEHPLGTFAAGPMVKILDIPRALAARGYAHDGAFHVRVGERGKSLDLRIEGGVGRVTPSRARAKANDETVMFTPEGAASVLFGGVRPRDAARLGWLVARDSTIDRLDVSVAMPSFEVVDPF